MPPVIDAIERNPQRFLAFAGDRVEKAHALDEAAIATVARIRDDDVEEWALLGAPSGQPYDDHDLNSRLKKVLII